MEEVGIYLMYDMRWYVVHYPDIPASSPTV